MTGVLSEFVLGFLSELSQNVTEKLIKGGKNTALVPHKILAPVSVFPISLYYCTIYDCAITIKSYL